MCNTMHHRKSPELDADSNQESNVDNSNRDNRDNRDNHENHAKFNATKGRHLKYRIKGFELHMKCFILSITILYGVAWTMTSNEEINTSKFQIESKEAPKCRAIWSPEDISTTLVTQLSDERLWMMEHHCERYGSHAMSIAVYSNKTRDDIVNELVEMGCRVDEGVVDPFDEKKDRSLVTVEVIDTHTHGAWNDYPINELRNLAMKGVKTTHMTYIDIDFWPNTDFYEKIMAPAVRQKMFEDPQLALVIPAFQLIGNPDCADEDQECREERISMLPKTVHDLKLSYKNQKVRRHESTNEQAQLSTDYQHWFQHQLHPHKIHEHLHEIPCLKSRFYEPFLTIRYCRDLTPPFQSIFSGYGKNKMTWMTQVVASGFTLAQVGGAYVVHYPHANSNSREVWNRAPKQLVQIEKTVRSPEESDGDLGFDQFRRGQVDNLYVEFRQWLKESIPEERARMGMCRGAVDDDNDLWIDPRRKNWNHVKKKKKGLRDRIREMGKKKEKQSSAS
mmetsp:Transcript_18728/g.43355  ORF Transcript_18728/g.43355 Transcript_18728/m.43355 type:complete len:504 (-) Transcript_18728:48-1559(-)